MRIALGIEYDGSNYFGWQAQKHTTKTLQYVVEKAASIVANQQLQIQCAGRTDTGVHATCQVVHFDTDAVRTERNWLLGINANLPNDVVIRWVTFVSEEFHARFSAVARSYRYIFLHRMVPSSLLRNKVTWSRKYLDWQQMQLSANHLLGRHDFSSYRAVACQAKSPVRTISAINFGQKNDIIWFDITADGFLHHMVRNIAGVLMRIGCGEAEIDWSRQVLLQRDRTMAGVTAPPAGLYLTKVTYPADFGLPEYDTLPLIVG